MKIHRRSKLYLPALSIVAGVLILLAVTGYSTYRNLDRAEKRVLADVRHQAAMLLRALEAATRTHREMPLWGKKELDRLFLETARDAEIHAVYLADGSGKVLHHSNSELVGTQAAWMPETVVPQQMPHEMVRQEDGRLVFFMAKGLSPTAASAMTGADRMAADRLPAEAALVVGLSMEIYERARQADIQHAVFMGAIMVSLGTGALFFLFVIQNYYLVGRAFRQTRDDTRQVIRYMADGLVSVDRRGRLLFLNPQAALLLGLDGVPAAGADLSPSIPFEEAGIRAALESGEMTLNREIRIEAASGNPVTLSFNVTPLLEDDGSVRGAVALIRDLTELKTLEMQMRRAETLAAVGELAATVAHEVRNPLSSIRTGVQFLIRRLDPDNPESEYGRLIVNEIDRINRVVADLLTFSRPNLPDRKPENLSDLCRHAIQLVKNEIDAKAVAVVLSGDDSEPAVDIDRHQLIQVMLNLLLNALAAVEEGGRIEVKVAAGATGRFAEISVADSGPGIAENDLERIFEPFFTTKTHGTGLGLAIAKKMIEGHGGRICARSPVPGSSRGSVFTVSLPAAPRRYGNGMESERDDPTCR